jgi:hypothetical protein
MAGIALLFPLLSGINESREGVETGRGETGKNAMKAT